MERTSNLPPQAGYITLRVTNIKSVANVAKK
jgi:hypothetical protein